MKDKNSHEAKEMLVARTQGGAQSSGGGRLGGIPPPPRGVLRRSQRAGVAVVQQRAAVHPSDVRAVARAEGGARLVLGCLQARGSGDGFDLNPMTIARVNEPGHALADGLLDGFADLAPAGRGKVIQMAWSLRPLIQPIS
jgi:hypothetical protein